jgi:uncharacterized protein
MARHDDDDDDRDRDEAEGEEEDRKSSKKKRSGELSEDDEKLWGMLGHLSSLVLGFIGPLVVMIIYKDKSRFVESNAKEALNFDLTMLIAILVTCGFGAIIVGPMAMIFHIIGGLAANKGEDYQYPMTIRFIK